MSTALRKTALSAALLSLGLAMSASAQYTGSTTTTATGSKTANPPAASSTATATTSPDATVDRNAPRGASDAKLSHGDRKFIEEAAQGGMAEVELGQLAAQKAQTDQVKQFGQKMADDHAKANDQLKQLASSKGVSLPTDLDHSAKRERDRLSKLSGIDFDREYMKHMVSDHKKDVKEFQKEAKGAKDPDVKSFAGATLPTLEQHLQLAQSTDAVVRTASRSSNTAHTSNTAPGTTSANNMVGNSGATTGSTGMPSTASPNASGSPRTATPPKPGT